MVHFFLLFCPFSPFFSIWPFLQLFSSSQYCLTFQFCKILFLFIPSNFQYWNLFEFLKIVNLRVRMWKTKKKKFWLWTFWSKTDSHRLKLQLFVKTVVPWRLINLYLPRKNISWRNLNGKQKSWVWKRKAEEFSELITNLRGTWYQKQMLWTLW